MLCVAALATLSSCSKDSEQTGAKWKCTYNEEFYGHFTENQYVGTEWEFASNNILYINGVQVAEYSLNTAVKPNFYEIHELCNQEPTTYAEIAEYLSGEKLSINGKTMECVNFEGEPLVTWSKM